MPLSFNLIEEQCGCIQPDAKDNGRPSGQGPTKLWER